MNLPPRFDTAFVCATPMEAAPLLVGLGATALQGAPCDAYASPATAIRPATLIVICGMGLAAAAAATAVALARWSPRQVVNSGIAGALNDDFAIGELVRIDETAQFDPAREEFARRRVRSDEIEWVARTLREARLFSSAVPVFDAARRAALSAYADLVDMEGAAIADVCAGQRVPCVLLKAVSDHADERATLLRNLDVASQALARHILAHYRRSTLEENWDERSGSNTG